MTKNIKLQLLNASMKEHRTLMPRPCIFKNKKHPDSKTRRVDGKRIIREEMEYLY